MCTSSSTIMYGLIIKTWTLLVAAQAFPKIQPILLALDMILLRRRNGQLRMSEAVVGKKNFSDLPEEIIGMVRTQVFGTVSMDDEARRFVYNRLECGRRDSPCECGDYHDGEHESSFVGSDWTRFVARICDDCVEIVDNFIWTLHSNQFTVLLESHGLVSTSNNFISEAEGYDLDEFYSAVSIPTPSNSITSEANHDTSRSSATPLSFDTTTIDTTRANSRFRRLVKDWGLKLYEDPVQMMGKTEEESITESENRAVVDEKNDGKVVKKEKVVKIEPKWFMWSGCTAIH